MNLQHLELGSSGADEIALEHPASIGRGFNVEIVPRISPVFAIEQCFACERKANCWAREHDRGC